MEIAGRKALVIGAARSGIASARFLSQRGATVALNDRKPLSDWSPAALDLKTEGVGLIAGDPPSWLLDQIDPDSLCGSQRRRSHWRSRVGFALHQGPHGRDYRIEWQDDYDVADWTDA